MCFKTNMQAKVNAVDALRFYNHDLTVEQRQDALDAIVTGSYLLTDHKTNVACNLACSMSSVMALLRAFESDEDAEFSNENPEPIRAIAKEFGRCAKGPVLQMQRILKRLLIASWKCGFSFSRLITKFLTMFNNGEQDEAKLVTLAIGLNFAFYSVRCLNLPKHSVPFRVDINKRGKIYLTYHYFNKNSRAKVIRWDLHLSVKRACPALTEMMFQDMRIKDSLFTK